MALWVFHRANAHLEVVNLERASLIHFELAPSCFDLLHLELTRNSVCPIGLASAPLHHVAPKPQKDAEAAVPTHRIRPLLRFAARHNVGSEEIDRFWLDHAHVPMHLARSSAGNPCAPLCFKGMSFAEASRRNLRLSTCF